MPSEIQRSVRHLDRRDWPFPWAGVFELAEAVPCRHWSLIGGLMVQLHCYSEGAEPPRATADVDTIAHVEIQDQGSLAILQRGLSGLGYRASPSLNRGTPLHRYRRGDGDRVDQVDFLIADHVAPRIIDRLPMPTPVRAPGGTNALRRTEEFEIAHSDGSSRISSPDLVGALVLKVEAYTADARDRERHLKDAVVLATLPREDTWGSPLEGRAPQRLHRLIGWLEDPRRTGPAGIQEDEVSDAVIALEDLLDSQPE